MLLRVLYRTLLFRSQVSEVNGHLPDLPEKGVRLQELLLSSHPWLFRWDEGVNKSRQCGEYK